jgi:hypothetical protein
MGQRDAFGREIGEPPLPPVPQDAPAPKAAPAPARVRSIGSSSRNAASLAVTLLIVAGIAGLVVVGVGANTERGSGGSSLALPATATPKTSATPATPARPKLSLISRGAMVYALARLRGRGRLRLLRVARDRIDAQLVTRAGALRNVQVTAQATHDFGAAGSGAGALPTIPFAQVDPAAPGRILRAAARRAGRRASRVDHLVLLMLSDGQSWNVYFKPDGLHFMAGRHGEGLRKR